MKSTRSFLFMTALSLLGVLAAGERSTAQSYPARPVKIVVPYPPGGGNDLIARILAQKLSGNGGQFYVENHPGASGSIGTAAAANAPPDGYTLVIVNPDFVVQPVVRARPPYDPFTNFTPVSLIATAPESISVHPSLPVTNFKELIALVRSNPTKYSVALPGFGSSPHLASERLFKLTHRADVIMVPFQGAAPAVASTIAGHTEILPFGLSAVAAHIKDGKLRGLAIADSRRSPLLPDVPTLAEAGVPGHEVGFWVGLLAPAGTSAAIVKQLNQQVAHVVSLPDVQERLSTVGFRPIGSAPDEFEEHIRRETELWRRVVHEAGVKIN